MLLDIALYGDPVLRKKGIPIDKIDDEIRRLVDDMVETMLFEGRGMGLAAPQVHQSLNLFVTRVPIQQPDETWTDGTLRIFINPKILEVSSETWTYSEGCLSIPGISAKIERPVSVKIEASDLEGNRTVQIYSWIEGRCILHENDHINGVLSVDRVRGKERNEMEHRLREIKKNRRIKNR